MILADDVVSRVARSILVAIRTSNVERDALAWELTDEELAQIARAALEAARWGEMRQFLADSRSYLEAFRLKEAGKALMGEIGRMPIRQLCKHVDALLAQP